MTILDLADKSAWLPASSGKSLLSETLRLSRNIKGYHFPEHAGDKELAAAAGIVEKAVKRWNEEKEDPLYPISLAALSDTERAMLEDKGFLPSPLPNRPERMALYVNESGDMSVLVNGTDHIEIRCAGSDPDRLWRKASYLDSQLGRDISYAFDKEFGYLTASPYRVGTALRLSAVLFVPGLVGSGALSEAAARAAREGFTLKGFYENLDMRMPYVELTNAVTLGVKEETLAARMEQLLDDLEAAEHLGWSKVFKAGEMNLKDKVWRALGALKYARLMSREETISAAALIAAGIREDMFPDKDKNLVSRLLEAASGAYVAETTHKDNLDDEEEALWRAVLVRGIIERAGF